MGEEPLNAAQFQEGGLHGEAPPADPVPAAVQAGGAPAHDIAGNAAARGRRLSAHVATGDWHDLLNAVKARLRQTVEDPAALPPQAQETFQQVQASVLDCATALDQVHAMLAHELSRCRELDQELRTTQAALAQARAELAGTQAQDMRVHHLSLHDSLTGLPNRGFFCARLQRELAQTGPHPPLALMYLDLNGFKTINDTHGQAIGDALLRIVAARLVRAVRAEDMMSRLGDDEFGCLPSDWPEPEQLVQLAGKIFDAVAAPVKCGTLQIRVQPSIGIALYPSDGESPEDLLKHAEAAMLRAKRERSRHAFFDASALA